MIPIHLSLSGFLSYHDPVEIDFTSFDLACISGPNGAGKSSLLDAITWVLFAQARRRDDAVINTLTWKASGQAQVSLVFTYEGNIYRVQRIKPRDKTMLLEFFILQHSGDNSTQPSLSDLKLVTDYRLLITGTWKPLTERTMRETEERIQQVLRLDYETFANASFFLQGKADQFTQQRPGDRKRILSSILGLEIWEEYRQRAFDRRRALETEVDGLDGRLQEIQAELAEERERLERQRQLQIELERQQQVRVEQERIVATFRQIAATLDEQRRLVDTLKRQAEVAAGQLQESLSRLEERQVERQSYAEILARAEQVESAYAGWQALRQELEQLEQVASRFRQQEKRREAPRLEIQESRLRLEGEAGSFYSQKAALEAQRPEMEGLSAEMPLIESDITVAEARLARRQALELSLQVALQRQVELKSENDHLRGPMDDLKSRISQLEGVEGADCPLCGQPLSQYDRDRLLNTLGDQGTTMGDQFRANHAALRELAEEIKELESSIRGLAQAEAQLIVHKQSQARVLSRLEVFEGQVKAWERDEAPRLAEIESLLEQEAHAGEARRQLQEIDQELRGIGYDAAAHDAARQSEIAARSSEAEMRALEKARATLVPLEREIADLEARISAQRAESERQAGEFERLKVEFDARLATAPDLEAEERSLLSLQEAENSLRIELGAAQQKVLVLDDLKTRRKALEARREELGQKIGQYRQLERAFGRDGVPALLIEQALPEIEARANELLDRLSAGGMSVRFVTQAAYKDRRREDLRETLDIQISDSVGTRDYEMYSGGEAFRVNFAIRLALSEVLARRAGARLQTLVIDEGFGSQDTQGRQRLVEAIKLVRPDFAKVLVITHIDELKDAFPTRIEVEKTPRGSAVRVV